MQRVFLKTLLVLCLALVMAAPAMAKEKLIPKVDRFAFFIDHSGSMAMDHAKFGEEKIYVAKSLAGHLNERIPELGYEGAVYTFAPFKEYVAPAEYKAKNFSSPIDSIKTGYEVFGRQTPMGLGLMDLESGITTLSKRTAVIIFSDGESNLGADPVGVAQSLYSKYMGDLCFHVVSLADSADGQATLDAIAALKSCSVAVTAEDLMDEGKMNQFIEDVFFERQKVVEPKPEPKPEPQPEEVITFRSVTFDFDSSNIRDDMAPILDEAANILKEKSGDIVLEGHTCNIGSDEYNQGLSERRAASVKSYLEKMGVSGSRMKTMGYGESQPKYDNQTKEGRELNRRVEIRLQ